MFCLRNQDITDAKAFFYLFFMSNSGYFNIKDWCENFADQPIHQQAWLIHELTHVWQIQQGLAVVRKALFNRQYRYALKQGKQFLSYGIEQQAQMVQDYFLKKHYGEECSAYEQCIPFVAHKASFWPR